MACPSSETSKLPLPSYPPVSHTCYFKLFYPCFPPIMHLFSNKSNSYVTHTATQTPKHLFLLPEPVGLSTPSQQLKQPEVLSCTHNTHVLHHPFSKLSCRLNAALASEKNALDVPCQDRKRKWWNGLDFVFQNYSGLSCWMTLPQSSCKSSKSETHFFYQAPWQEHECSAVL